MATVLVVDDAPDIRELVRRILQPTPHEVVGEATDGASGLIAWRELAPKVVLLDHMMPVMSGLDAAEIMLAENPRQAIVLFTAFGDRTLFRQAEDMGIAACVTKTDVSSLPGLLAVVAGEPTYPHVT